ncbi:MAG: thioredoxin family protein [candidate division Zixibacteria bacterium]|nr:thioredoxin family protein [Candidatus Tariuqbacter arcticus]
MPATPSKMVALGTPAPNFKILDAITGKIKTLDELKSDTATVVMFFCNHCPFVKHVQSGVVQLVNDYILKGISFIAINPNDIENYPEDSPENMKKIAAEKGYKFPFLFDETQEVAKAYNAACTPDFFIYDKDMKLVYRGQMDDSRPGNNIPVTGEDVRAALDNILAGKPVGEEQKPSIGCDIKWKN